jgi:hypothetical protein
MTTNLEYYSKHIKSFQGLIGQEKKNELLDLYLGDEKRIATKIQPA